MVPVVNFLMISTGILSYPIALLLDCILGEDHSMKRFNASDLKTLIDLHSKKAIKEIEEEFNMKLDINGLDKMQSEIVKGAIDLDRDIKDIMITK